MAVDYNDLRRAGFSPRQSSALSANFGAQDSLQMTLPYSDPPVSLQWGWGGNANVPRYLQRSFTPQFTELQMSGNAFAFGATDPDSGYTELTYLKEGVYLCALGMHFVTDPNWDGNGPSKTTVASYIRFGDDYALSSETPKALGGESFPVHNTLTWMIQAAAGDVGSLPYVAAADTCQPMSVVSADFRVVRLLT